MQGDWPDKAVAVTKYKRTNPSVSFDLLNARSSRPPVETDIDEPRSTWLGAGLWLSAFPISYYDATNTVTDVISVPVHAAGVPCRGLSVSGVVGSLGNQVRNARPVERKGDLP